ncbi:MAG: restriction endonuclease [Acidobacteriota bacterium]
MKPPKHRLTFSKLSDTEFEEFTYDLLEDLGFVNLDWRKGTGKKTSPADSGRDIVGHLQRTDVDRSRRSERWFIDCKHYVKGIPAKELHNLLAWAEAERPDVALFVASNFLSNPAKDYLEAYRRNNHPPFVIKVWERTNLESMTRGKRDLLQMHGVLKSYVRAESEIGKAEQEFFDRVWYYRKLVMFDNIKAGSETIDSATLKRCKALMKEMRNKYGGDIGKLMDDWEWGYVNGKFAALRWVLGEEWDFLDT